MLKRTAFRADLNGEDARELLERANLAFDAVNEADRRGEENRGTIVCQLLRSNGATITIQGQFLPRNYAERVAAIFTEFANDLRAQEQTREPITFEPR